MILMPSEVSEALPWTSVVSTMAAHYIHLRRFLFTTDTWALLPQILVLSAWGQAGQLFLLFLPFILSSSFPRTSQVIRIGSRYWESYIKESTLSHTLEILSHFPETAFYPQDQIQSLVMSYLSSSKLVISTLWQRVLQEESSSLGFNHFPMTGCLSAIWGNQWSMRSRLHYFKKLFWILPRN